VKTAAYLRVSTDTQAEHRLGLDVQRQAIRAWARASGHKITGWHTDTGVSGSNGLDSREALPDAVAEVRAGGQPGWWSTAWTGWPVT
jgi:DNA invertase Pin-like site-specific DNA recombinase